MAETTETVIGAKGLKVIGAGFARTGTVSLKQALEALGFGPCYHMSELFKTPKHIKWWEAATGGKSIDWNNIFEEYQAAVDWPASVFYDELMKTYPDAKVILTVRDPDSWYKSIRNTVYRMSSKAPNPPLVSALFSLVRVFATNERRISQMIDDIIWERTFGDNFEDKQHALAVFNQHIEDVKKRVPPERLLIYDVKEGWEPLYAFLGVEVPLDKPFPYLNNRASFMGDKIWQKYKKRLVGGVLAASSIAALLLLLGRSKREAVRH